MAVKGFKKAIAIVHNSKNISLKYMNYINTQGMLREVRDKSR